MAKNMERTVIRLREEEKRRFYINIAKMRKMVDSYWDQKQPDPSWSEFKELFNELEDARNAWATYATAVEIFHDED